MGCCRFWRSAPPYRRLVGGLSPPTFTVPKIVAGGENKKTLVVPISTYRGRCRRLVRVLVVVGAGAVLPYWWCCHDQIALVAITVIGKLPRLIPDIVANCATISSGNPALLVLLVLHPAALVVVVSGTTTLRRGRSFWCCNSIMYQLI